MASSEVRVSFGLESVKGVNGVLGPLQKPHESAQELSHGVMGHGENSFRQIALEPKSRERLSNQGPPGALWEGLQHTSWG